LNSIGKTTGDIICHTFFGEDVIDIEINNWSLSEEV
jgi:hypothetical protein